MNYHDDDPSNFQENGVDQSILVNSDMQKNPNSNYTTNLDMRSRKPLPKLEPLVQKPVNFNQNDNQQADDTKDEAIHRPPATIFKLDKIHPIPSIVEKLDNLIQHEVTIPKIEEELLRNSLYEQHKHLKTFDDSYFQYSNRSVYKGQWFHGKRHGLGKHYSAQFIYYYGYWENDIPGPLGQLVKYSEDQNTVLYYNGSFKNGLKDGKGILGWVDRKSSLTYKYDGEFKEDLKHGSGKEWGLNNEVFTGYFKNNMKEGNGTLTFKSGTKYEGNFVKNKMNGHGKIVYFDQRVYEGEFLNDKMHGRGKMTWPNKKGQYEGQFVNDYPEGFGVMKWGDGKEYEGEWFLGLQHGKGRLKGGEEINWVDGVAEKK